MTVQAGMSGLQAYRALQPSAWHTPRLYASTTCTACLIASHSRCLSSPPPRSQIAPHGFVYSVRNRVRTNNELKLLQLPPDFEDECQCDPRSCGGARYRQPLARQFEHGCSAKVEVRAAGPGMGLGLFAQEDMPKG